VRICELYNVVEPTRLFDTLLSPAAERAQIGCENTDTVHAVGNMKLADTYTHRCLGSAPRVVVATRRAREQHIVLR